MATETNKALIPMTNEHFAAWCLKMVGQPYWFGTAVYKCTSSLLSRKTGQYPSHYGSSRSSRYRQDIASNKVCADCIGSAKGYAWTSGGIGVLEKIGTDNAITNQYGSNGCPDKGAGGMFTYSKSKGMDWGRIGTIPEIVGLAVHQEGHVGYYVGNGYVVEWRGFAYGCVKTKLKDRGWQYWYKLPFINYKQSSVSVPTDTSDSSVRSLSYTPDQTMFRGEDVRELQELLNRLGFDCGIADGIFGPKTSAAVEAFQRTKDLEEDGIVGSGTWTALEAAKQGTETEDPSNESPEGQEDPDEEDETDGVTEDGSGQQNYGTRLLRYKAGTPMQQGADILAVQNRIIQLGFDPGKADGIYGPKTADAIKAFQQSVCITSDGIVGPVTRELLAQ